MQLARHRFTYEPRSFGRGPVKVLSATAPARTFRLSADLKLFATTFVAGFLFVSVYLA